MKRQVRLKTLLLIIPLLCLAFALFATKWRQDAMRRAAFGGLSEVGFSCRIGGPDGLELDYDRRWRLSEAEAARALTHLASLEQPYDLGMTPGTTVGAIRFNSVEQRPSVIAQFEERFPGLISGAR